MKDKAQDFPGGPLAKTPPSQRRECPGTLIPGLVIRSHMPQLRPSTAK